MCLYGEVVRVQQRFFGGVQGWKRGGLLVFFNTIACVPVGGFFSSGRIGGGVVEAARVVVGAWRRREEVVVSWEEEVLFLGREEGAGGEGEGGGEGCKDVGFSEGAVVVPETVTPVGIVYRLQLSEFGVTSGEREVYGIEVGWAEG